MLLRGIVIRKTESGEHHQLVTLYTKELGKIRVMAKSAKKNTSKQAGHLDLFNLADFVKNEKHKNPKLQCILVDEAQFLKKEQVRQLVYIVDQLHLPVLAYGLRSDFRGEPFEGSQYLLIWADNIVEIKTICHCGKKAIMNVRIDSTGHAMKTGAQVQIGGNDKYTPMCRKHFHEAMQGR